MTRLAFDADVLIYAAAPGPPLGERVWSLLSDKRGRYVGSLLLLPELLTKPIRMGAAAEVEALRACLAPLELLPVDAGVAALAVQLGAAYRLRALDAVHLATAVEAGADGFLTNNRKDFQKGRILELAVLYPEEL